MKVDYYEKLENVIELQYHNKQNEIFLFKYYCYDTNNKGIIVDLHHGLIKINIKARLRNTDDVFVLAKYANMFITYTLFPLEIIILELIGCL